MELRVTLSRREFLKMTGVAASATALGACAPSLIPTEDEAEVEIVPTATAVPVQPTPTATEEAQTLTITIVYNNIAHDARMSTAWGFGALIEYGDQQVLFDTGGDSPTLLGNMAILGIDPTTIQKVVLSHIHGDHIGGLEGLLATGIRPTVYVPPSFPDDFKDRVSALTDLVEVTPGHGLAEGVFTTGEMPTPGSPTLVEQSLVVEFRGGWVIITGCAHPGIVEIVRQARELFGGPVFLVMGGFHLRDKREAEIADILADFRQLEVERVAPSHCTGERAIATFAAEYGDKFIHSGAGTVIVI